MRRAGLAGATVLVLTVVACGGDTAVSRRSAPTPTTSGAPYDVTVTTETFVDASRGTPEPASLPRRMLVTTIRYPSGDGPFPLVVLAHGLNGHPRKFDELTTVWARAGYVVALPAFPLTNDEAPAGTSPGDFSNQPRDMSFVVDQVLGLAAAGDHPLAGRVDSRRIGVAGLSLGAATTLAVAYHTCCRDRRIDAAISMAGVLLPFAGSYELAGAPLLLLHGDADGALPYRGSADVYERARPPKHFVTIVGGGHAPPFEDDEDLADDMVAATTLDFWDLYLKGDRAALDRLIADAEVVGLTTAVHDPR